MDCSMLSHVRNRTRPMAPSRDRGGGAKGMVGMGSHRHRDDRSHRGWKQNQRSRPLYSKTGALDNVPFVCSHGLSSS